jgi:hypothetical protein
MLWNSLECLDCLTLKSFSCKVRSAVQNLTIEQLIKFLTQKMNNFQKFDQKKTFLIHAEMVKVLH